MKVLDFNKRKEFSEVSGVTSAVDSRISVLLNDDGMYEEVIRDNSTKELNPLVEYVSPNLNQNRNETDISKDLFSKVNNIKFDSRIGYYLSMYIGHVSEDNYRGNASSGGMGTWILKELLAQDLVDGVIHVKKAKKGEKVLFKYGISRTIEEVKKGSKTKYYPVELSQVIKEVKNKPGRYAVVGIPSFITSIRLLSEVDEEIKDSIKFTIGLICGHQKSSKFAESMAWQMGIHPSNIESIDFRKKNENLPASKYSVEVTGTVGNKSVRREKPITELIGQNWGQGYFKVSASDYTDDVMNETADITLGDAWLPEYVSDSKGNNIIIIRNPKIEKIILNGIQKNKVQLEEVNKEKIFESQEGHYRHTHDELSYRLFKKDKKKEWRPNKRVKASNEIDFFRKKIQNLRLEISSKSHVYYKEAEQINDFEHYKNKMNKLSNKYDRIYKIFRLSKIGINGLIKVAIRKIINK